MNTLLLRSLTLISYVIMVVMNFLAVTLPIGGRGTGEISDSYPNLFAPAGFTFSVWGIIYSLLAVYSIYQFLRPKDLLLSRINRLFIPNALLNALWILCWHYDQLLLSVGVMVCLLWTLVRIADIVRLPPARARVPWVVRLPFSTYFGWITVATIANITTFLVSIGWRGFGLSEVFWTITILLIGASIGILRMQRDQNIAYGLVLIWAYWGILSKHTAESGFASMYPSILTTVLLCIVAFTFTILSILKNASAHRRIH